jgi:hypothetical protein
VAIERFAAEGDLAAPAVASRVVETAPAAEPLLASLRIGG